MIPLFTYTRRIYIQFFILPIAKNLVIMVNMNKIRDIFLIWISIPKKAYFCSMFILTTQTTAPLSTVEAMNSRFGLLGPFIHTAFHFSQVLDNTSRSSGFKYFFFLARFPLSPRFWPCNSSLFCWFSCAFKSICLKIFYETLQFLVKTLIQITYATILKAVFDIQKAYT